MPRITRLLAPLLVLLAPSSGHALFHLAHIHEVMSGAAGNSNIQYVEIRMNAAGQNVTGQTRLTAFNCDGTSFSILLLVPSNVTNAGPDVRWIMASPDGATFLAASSITPDFTWNNGATGSIDPTCGMVCWGAPGIVPPAPTWDASNPNNYVDCVGYGGYTGPTKTSTHDGTPTSGTPSSLPPGDGTLSLTRMSFTGNNAADFALACPTPENNNGAVGTFGPCTPPTTTTTTLPRSPRRSKCTSRKLEAAGRKAAAKARCAAAAVARGASVKSGCTAAAEGAFTRAWGKAEARKDCLAPTGDRAAVEGTVDAFLAGLASALESGSQRSKCTSRKLRAAGAKAAALAACDAKAFAKGTAVKPGCAATAAGNFGAAWSRAEKRGDCQAGTGDAARIEDQVDEFAGALVAALAP